MIFIMYYISLTISPQLQLQHNLSVGLEKNCNNLNKLKGHSTECWIHMHWSLLTRALQVNKTKIPYRWQLLHWHSSRSQIQRRWWCSKGNNGSDHVNDNNRHNNENNRDDKDYEDKKTTKMRKIQQQLRRRRTWHWLQ